MAWLNIFFILFMYIPIALRLRHSLNNTYGSEAAEKFNKYNSIALASKIEKIAYNTLLFRDTNVPFRCKLYYTKCIIDF